jgi:hypothetical protein
MPQLDSITANLPRVVSLAPPEAAKAAFGLAILTCSPRKGRATKMESTLAIGP